MTWVRLAEWKCCDVTATGRMEVRLFTHLRLLCSTVLTGSPSRGGDLTVYVPVINQPSLTTPAYSVVMSVSVFMALFNCVSFYKFSRQLSAFSLCSSGLISALLVLSTIHKIYLYESLPQP